MSEQRETPATRAAEDAEAQPNLGAPVEETTVTETEVLDAVERANGAAGDAGSPDAQAPAADAAKATAMLESDALDAAQGAAAAAETTVVDADQGVAPNPEFAELARRQAISEVDTQMSINMAETQQDPTLTLDDLPTAAADPVRDGEIRISADHPMAALYMQSPMPPEIKGNRGAGSLIAIVAAVAFAVLGAGLYAAWIAPHVAPSQFGPALTELVMTWQFGWAVAAFLVGIIVLVMIVGRAGWWAYVLGGFFVGVCVWLAAVAGSAVDDLGFSSLLDLAPAEILKTYGLTLPAVAAGVLAREVTVWFGAWIGRRGRRMKTRNAEALTEYEEALAEVQAKKS